MDIFIIFIDQIIYYDLYKYLNMSMIYFCRIFQDVKIVSTDLTLC